MKVAVFSTRGYDRTFLDAANQGQSHELVYFDARLSQQTAPLAEGFPCVCVFTNDALDRRVLRTLAQADTKHIALRCAGFNNVDIPVAQELGFTVARVPAYSPHAVAEHTVALILALNRKIYRAWSRVREQNFELDGLMGFDLHGRTVGIVGTGKIGCVVAKIMAGFGCRVIAFDPNPHEDCLKLGVTYLTLKALAQSSDIITLHSPLTPETRHLFNDETFGWLKPGAMLINTSRGAIIDTKAAIDALKSGRLGYLGLDVYEEEAALFAEDRSDEVLQDDVFARLLTFPNVIVTAHQAFFTQDALQNIAQTTLQNITSFQRGQVAPENKVV